jgi:hypothetical protein
VVIQRRRRDPRYWRAQWSEHHPVADRAPPDALRRIAPGEAVLVYGNVPPAHLRLRTWFTDPVLRARATTAPPTSRGR